MKNPKLVILAAGMGSRYGGLKQIDPVGPDGELLIDYSLRDAHKAGFRDVVFIIKKEIEKDFIEIIGKRTEEHFNVQYAFQSFDKLPCGYSVHPDRVKPLGTTHAILCAEKEVDGAPFCLINSDDYYGPEAYKQIFTFLSENTSETNHAMVGYVLGNTLTDNGSVARGVCSVSDGKLVEIVERTKIIKTETGAAFTLDGESFTDIPAETPVSLNFWGFMPIAFEAFKADFNRYLENEFVSNPLKSECFIPNTVGSIIKSGAGSVTVLSSKDNWHGVTYKEDKPHLVAALNRLTDEGVYTTPLWK